MLPPLGDLLMVSLNVLLQIKLPAEHNQETMVHFFHYSLFDTWRLSDRQQRYQASGNTDCTFKYIYIYFFLLDCSTPRSPLCNSSQPLKTVMKRHQSQPDVIPTDERKLGFFSLSTNQDHKQMWQEESRGREWREWAKQKSCVFVRWKFALNSHDENQNVIFWCLSLSHHCLMTLSGKHLICFSENLFVNIYLQWSAKCLPCQMLSNLLIPSDAYKAVQKPKLNTSISSYRKLKLCWY